MTSSALSEKPAGRPLCSPEPIARVGGLTSAPAGPPGVPRRVNALAAASGPESQGSDGKRSEGEAGRWGPGGAAAPRSSPLWALPASSPADALSDPSVVRQLSVRLRDAPAPSWYRGLGEQDVQPPRRRSHSSVRVTWWWHFALPYTKC